MSKETLRDHDPGKAGPQDVERLNGTFNFHRSAGNETVVVADTEE